MTRALRGYLLATAGVSGAAVMVVEVVGSRVVGPFFGVSLFVWTSLITVTLLALALGYALGGRACDRRPTPEALYTLVGVAGLCALAVPWLKAPVLRVCLSLGLRAGSLASAALLFGPCLVLLGCVSPYVVRLATRDLAHVGRTVGLFAAVSTGGSFLGTLLTGFVLIAYLGVAHVFTLVGALLLLLSGGYFAFFRGRRAALLVALVPLAVPAGRAPIDKLMANGTRVSEVARREGFYGTVQVLEYSYGARRTREMVIDGLVQGGIDTADGLSIYEYSYFLEQLPWGLRPSGGRCLVIGAGAGLVPSWYAARGVLTDVVEINPDVLTLARAHFAFQVSGDVFVEDARAFLRRPGRRYDYIVLDAFTGDTTPAHLLTREALDEVRARLAPGGVVAANVAGSLGQATLMTASIARTFESVFPDVRLHPTFDPEAGERYGNLVVIASDRPLGAWDPVRGAPPRVHAFAREAVALRLGRGWRFPPGTPALVLSDDFNPFDARDAWLKERIRRDMLANTDWDVLL